VSADAEIKEKIYQIVINSVGALGQWNTARTSFYHYFFTLERAP
jgi:hypothetical protein